MSPSLLNLQTETLLAERVIDSLMMPRLEIGYGPAVLFGFKVKITSFSDRYVWAMRDKKDIRVPRHWLLGNSCKQGGVYVI